MQVPFFKELSKAKSVLIVGAGGGFDVISGLPLLVYLKSQNIEVTLANLSFTKLYDTNADEEYEHVFAVNDAASDLPYFPEKRLYDWLIEKDMSAPIYGILYDSGVKKLSAAYRYLIEKHDVDTLILIDGGTDSLMFGDEARVGTIVEDACSITAASQMSVERNFTAAIGFGVEHDFNHYACLENISTLIKSGDFLGSVSLTEQTDEGKAFIDFVNHINSNMRFKSIVINSIKSAMLGEFGDYHAIGRTAGTVQFVSSLMCMYLFFNTKAISKNLKFGAGIEDTESMSEVANEYRQFRYKVRPRADRAIPLK